MFLIFSVITQHLFDVVQYYTILCYVVLAYIQVH